MTNLRVALLSSCTIELLHKPFLAALEARGFQSSFWTGGFGQFRQDVLNPSSALYSHEPAVIVLYLNGSDLFQEILENPFAFSVDARRELALRWAGEVAGLVEILAQRLPQATVLLNTVAIDAPNALAGLEYNSDYGIWDAVNAYNAELSVIARRFQTAVIIDVASLAASVGFEKWRDSRMWYLARSPWSRQALQALAERYAATVCGRLGRNRKCVVLDLDNTLWGGIVGEDGLKGLGLGEDGIGRAFVEFQLELLNMYRKGVLLAICSKNNPEDALEVIRRHPAMRLHEEHFAAMRINWEDKAINLRALAEELNIGLDSLVFLDDNPVERSWIRQSAPEVLVPDWPTDPAEYKIALLDLSSRYFCAPAITEEDRRRGAAYQGQAERRKLAASSSSLEDFYRTLQMRARIGQADSFTVPRIAQLTQKTNQFNLTTRRYSEAEITAINGDPDCAIWWLDLSDRFGPSGLVGVLILKRRSPDIWLIDTFLLSCRVMGRTAENAFLAIVAREIGAAKLVGEFKPTAKNLPVRDLYARLGFQALPQGEAGEFWELNLSKKSLELPGWFEIDIVRNGVAA
jgi:FkbH-like protein